MEPCSKKRKVDIEARSFNDNWTEKYFFTNFKNQPTCLICKQAIAVIKEYNIQRHYNSNHQNYKAYIGQIRKDKVESLKRNFRYSKLFLLFQILSQEKLFVQALPLANLLQRNISHLLMVNLSKNVFSLPCKLCAQRNRSYLKILVCQE